MSVRTAESEAHAERIAFGLFCLDTPLWRDPALLWRNLDDTRRDLCMARARFVLAMAESIPQEVPA